MIITICPICGTAYTTQDKCPNLSNHTEATQSPKTGANSDLERLSSISVANTQEQGLLSLAEYLEKYKRSSKTEYERYKYLWACLQDGTIQDLNCQPKFKLLQSIKLSANCLREQSTQRAITYAADFSYTYNGLWVIEDVKPTYGNSKNNQKHKRVGKAIVSDVSRLRHKMLQALYPAMVFKIVTDVHEAIESVRGLKAA